MKKENNHNLVSSSFYELFVWLKIAIKLTINWSSNVIVLSDEICTQRNKCLRNNNLLFISCKLTTKSI